MYIPRLMPSLGSRLMEQIKAEEKVVQSPQRKMKFCRRLEAEDSDEVSETNSVFKMKINTFADMFKASSPRSMKRIQYLKDKGHRFWSLTEG